MITDFIYNRIAELLSLVGTLFLCIFLVAFAADILYYALAGLRLIKSNPEYSPFRPIPFERRVQAMACGVVGSVIFICVLFSIYCLLNLQWTWWWFLPYVTYCFLDKTPERGGRPSKWFRRNIFYMEAANYFPTNLLKWNADTQYTPDRPYLFGYHPHGIFGMGCVTTFGSEGRDISRFLPGLDIRCCTLNIIFICPFLRDWALALGFISVGKDSLDYVLKQGNGKGAVVVVGGAREAIETRVNSHDLVLLKRKGFFKIALRHGVRLVPVYCFGENNVFGIVEMPGWKERFSAFSQKYLGFTIPSFIGRGVFQKHFGFLPARHPLNVVLGDPIDCPRIEHPKDEQVDEVGVNS